MHAVYMYMYMYTYMHMYITYVHMVSYNCSARTFWWYAYGEDCTELYR